MSIDLGRWGKRFSKQARLRRKLRKARNDRKRLFAAETLEQRDMLSGLAITEVAPWSSSSPVGADWFEVTNTSASAIDITGWKVDDNSNSFASALSLNGITSIAAGESVIFMETSSPATAATTFRNTWFGGAGPAGLQIGSYTGSSIGLSTGSDAVNLYSGNGTLQASVNFGASPGGPSLPTFNNAAGLDATTISVLSSVGVNGAFAAAGDANEIGSPGTVGYVFISEVHPSGSGNGNYGVDWFEVTNTGPNDVNISGWKVDDNSNAFANAVALRGVTTIPAGKSAVFFEGDATGTTDATITAAFSTAWFGTSTPPAGFLIGAYGGNSVGLSTSNDAVNLFNAAGLRITGVSFGAATATATFNNAAGLGSGATPLPAISTLSVAGTNGAYLAPGLNETGSPGTIVNPPTPVVTITATDATAAEAASEPGTFRIARTGGTATSLTVTYTLATGAGKAVAADFTPALSGTAIIGAGQAFVDVTITPVDDANVEGSEDVTLTVTDTVDYDLGATTVATVTIADNDFPPNLIISEVHPSGSGNGNYASDWIEVTNLGATDVDITGWKIDDDSNSFASGVTLRGVTVVGAGKSVVFVESNATGTTDAAKIAAFSSTWFGNATPPIGVSIGAYGGSGIGLGTGGDAVNLFDAGGNRVTGVSFGAATASATFDNSAGLGNMTLPLPAISTLSAAGTNGAFTVTLTPPGNTTETGSPGTIVNSPTPIVTITATDATAAEAASEQGTFRIARTGSTASALSVSYSIATGAGKAAAADYTPTLTGTVIIGVGQAFVDVAITPVDDSDVESSEDVTLTLVDTADYNLGANTFATVTISDNDTITSAIDLSKYVRIARYNLPEPTQMPAPPNNLLAQEASAVTYNWDTDTLFIAADGGTAIVQVTKTGQLVDTMTLAQGNSPQGTEFYDTEGITYIGNGQFVMAEERDRQLVLFTYAAGTTLTRGQAKTVKIGTFVNNTGTEGLSYDPATGGYIVLKEIDPIGIFQTNVDFNAGTATNGSPSTVNSNNLFDPALLGMLDVADVFALSNLPDLSGDPEFNNLLVLSQESAKIVNIDRSGNISSSLTIVTDPGDVLTASGMQHEGLTMDRNGFIYIVNENGGGDINHPQLWVYAPSDAENQAPTAVTLTNQVNSILENTSTSSRVKVAGVVVTDDGLGTNNLSVTGTDKDFFEVDNTGLYIKAGTVLDFETKSSYSVTVQVDDPNVGASPDATASFSLSITDQAVEAPPTPTLIISEVAPWSSGNGPVGADWIEVTNISSSAVNITGWKMDDSSPNIANAVALNGITSIAAGESVIFLEVPGSATPQAIADIINNFKTVWFGGNVPAGLQVGSYGGAGVGLSTGGDAVNLFNGSGAIQASVSFGSSPSGPFPTFNNAAGLNNATITTMSAIGVNGAFVPPGDSNAIGSPGTIGKLFISEVAPWSSSSPVGADWFEVTNTTANAIDLTGWKMDDNSGSFVAAVALTGITSIAPGESVIFLETSNLAATAQAFIDTWFGGSAPAGLQIGGYSGSGVGLSTGNDAVNLYNSSGVLQVSVSFSSSPTGPFPTFENVTAINHSGISQLSVAGTHGAFVAALDAGEVGSPGSIQGPGLVPEIGVQGNGLTISDGDTTPSPSDDTDFGSATVVGGSVSRIFTITNTGSLALNLSGAPKVVVGGANPADFVVTLQPTSPIGASGGSTTFTVVFDPTSGGTRSATISIANSDSSENPYNFMIQGIGLAPEIDVLGGGVSILDGDVTPSTADATDFGGAVVAGQTVVQTFTILNTGSHGLNLTGTPKVTISGANAGDFTVAAQPTSPITAGGNTTFQISFDPSALGLRTATVSIASDDGDEGTYDFAISGTGTQTSRYRFDFNTVGSPTQTPVFVPGGDGFMGVLPTDIYSEALGFGWNSAVSGLDRGAMSGVPTSDLLRDAQYFSRTGTANNGAKVFSVDLPNGVYWVNVTMGDKSASHDQMQVNAEGGAAELTGISNTAGQFAQRGFSITVGDGQLNLEFSDLGGESSWVLNALDVRPLGGGELTISAPSSLAADGTTVTTFSGTGASPGSQLTINATLGTIVGSDSSALFQGIQSQADANGNFAFAIQAPSSGGASFINVSQADGQRQGLLQQTYDINPVRRLDFNGPSGYAAPGFLAVRASSTYSPSSPDPRGFGWATAPGELERTGGTYSALPLRRDGHYGLIATPDTFYVSVKPNTSYGVRVYVGDVAVARDLIQVSVEGVAPYTVAGLVAGGFDTRTVTGISTDGSLAIIIADLGRGGSNNDGWSVSGIDIWEIGANDPGASSLLQAASTPDAASAGKADILTSEALAPIVAEAIARWAATGISADQLAVLQNTQFQVLDLGANAHELGNARPGLIQIDDDAAGHGWFIDSTPADDFEFSVAAADTERQALAGVAAERMDLLALVMHELGHELGWEDLDDASSPHSLMTENIAAGTRRTPTTDEAATLVLLPGTTSSPTREQAFAALAGQTPATAAGSSAPTEKQQISRSALAVLRASRSSRVRPAAGLLEAVWTQL